jgi:hypothetical protein
MDATDRPHSLTKITLEVNGYLQSGMSRGADTPRWGLPLALAGATRGFHWRVHRVVSGRLTERRRQAGHASARSRGRERTGGYSPARRDI